MMRANKPWTREEDNYLIENYGTLYNFQLGEKLGRTAPSIRTRVSTLKDQGKIDKTKRAPSARAINWNKHNEEIRNNHMKMTYRELAKKLGLPFGGLIKHIRTLIHEGYLKPKEKSANAVDKKAEDLRDKLEESYNSEMICMVTREVAYIDQELTVGKNYRINRMRIDKRGKAERGRAFAGKLLKKYEHFYLFEGNHEETDRWGRPTPYKASFYKTDFATGELAIKEVV